MKGITIWQPWSTLIALELKRYETIGGATKYRGLLAIHAAKNIDLDAYREKVNRSEITEYGYCERD